MNCILFELSKWVSKWVSLFFSLNPGHLVIIIIIIIEMLIGHSINDNAVLFVKAARMRTNPRGLNQWKESGPSYI